MSKYDFWTHQGGREFGLVPAGILNTATATPICLQRGDATFGETHIRLSHGRWLYQRAASVPDLVWKKCRQSGQFISSENEADKVKVVMRVAPDALLILRRIQSRTDSFFTVVSLYRVPDDLDGSWLGRYSDTLSPLPASPVFVPPKSLPSKVQVFVKKSRGVVIPQP